MKTSIVIIIWPPIPYLAKFWFSSSQKCCQNAKMLLANQIAGIFKMKYLNQKVNGMVKFIFGMQKFEVFYKLILSFWVSITRFSQSTQNKKFGDVVDFLPVDKFESFLQVNSITLGVHSQACPNYQKHQVWITSQYLKENVKDKAGFSLADKRQRFLQINTISLQYLEKKGVRKLIFCMHMSMKVDANWHYEFDWDGPAFPKLPKKQLCSVITIFQMKLIFFMQLNTKVYFKLISTLLASKFPTGWYYHYWWVCSSILKALKATSLKYLYNMLKKVGMDFIFCMQINIKIDIIVFHESGQTCSKYPKWEVCNIFALK